MTWTKKGKIKGASGNNKKVFRQYISADSQQFGFKEIPKVNEPSFYNYRFL